MAEFFTYTLPNGIRCVLKRTNSPVAYCAVTINAGSRDELNSEFGIAHFTEHSLFKGTERRKAYHINSRLEKLGGELNAFTTKEETVVYATSLKTDLPKAVELLSDVLFNSVFPEKEISKEREVVIDEINSYKDVPAERIYDEFEDLLFKDSELGHNILGCKRLVSKFDHEAILDFVKRCYNTDEMVFSVAANISESKFIKLAEMFFHNEMESTRRFQRKKPVTNGVFCKPINRATHQAHCVMGNVAYNLHDPKRTPLALLVNILGGPAANSYLNVLLREKNGLSYMVEAAYTPYSDTGIATVYFSTDKDKSEQCIELVNEALTKFKNTELTSRQLSMAKKQFAGQLSIAMESNEGYMLSAAKSYLVYNDIDSQETVYKRIASVTASEIMEVANETFGDVSSLIYK